MLSSHSHAWNAYHLCRPQVGPVRHCIERQQLSEDVFYYGVDFLAYKNNLARRLVALIYMPSCSEDFRSELLQGKGSRLLIGRRDPAVKP